jgi:hypothetical protein
MAREYLPGQPSQKRIREVRSWLNSLGIRPLKHTGAGRNLWHMAWEWAEQISRSYISRPLWPSAREIASQYVLLLLMHAHERSALKLPYRAGKELSPGARQLLDYSQPFTVEIDVQPEITETER